MKRSDFASFNHFATPCIRPYTLSGCEKVILCLTPENTEGYEAPKGYRLICHIVPCSRGDAMCMSCMLRDGF